MSSPAVIRERLHPPRTSEADGLDANIRQLVLDLHTARPAIFWTDLVATAAIGWSAFAAATILPLFSAWMLALAVIAGLALYRGLCFVHELTHLRRGSIPGFETAWNVLFGVPLFLPSFTYLGVHEGHHNLATYGTPADPEYLPFARSQKLIVIFSLQSSLVLPALLAVRFLLLAPLGLLSTRFHQWLEVHASSFAMNPKYRRTMTAAMTTKMRRWETLVLSVWAPVILAVVGGYVPLRLFVVWYLVVAFISFLNVVRVLGAHEYDSDGSPRDRRQQLSDSIDTPGGPWTELWAPVGLRYHALHHYFPGIPYHNLGTAYWRILNTLPAGTFYQQSTSPSLGQSLKKLYRRARAGGRALHAGW